MGLEPSGQVGDGLSRSQTQENGWDSSQIGVSLWL